MDRVAVLVDAGYFFAAESALVSGSGNQRRDSPIFDEKSAVKELPSRKGLPKTCDCCEFTGMAAPSEKPARPRTQ